MPLFFQILTQNCYTLIVEETGNKLAHSLTRYLNNVFDYVAWMEEVPQSLFSVAQNDLTTLANQVQ